MNKIVGIGEILNDDVIIATEDFSCDPFAEDKARISRAELASHRISATIKIAILGQPKVGKSALALRFCKADFLSYYEQTIEEE